ncbi:MAG: ABC transporter permease [Gammaproteobacteria bacterium]|nr:ABC transporter permease [Gammaproteobacteria bacterium]
MNTRHNHLPFSMLLALAWRNLWRNRRRTLLTLISISLGFALAVMFIGIGDGSHNSMIRNAIKLGDGHLVVQPNGYMQSPANYKFIADGQQINAQLEQLKIPASIQPRVTLQVLASTASNSVGAALEGIVSSDDPRVELLRGKLLQGQWFESSDKRGVAIGEGMARKLKVSVGSKLVLMAGTQQGDTQAQLGRVRAVFKSGIEELDNFLVFADVSFAQQFLIGEGADANAYPVTKFAIFLQNPKDVQFWKNRIDMTLQASQTVVLDWQTMMPQLLQFVMLDDAGNYVFLILIMTMLVFGIVNTVLMSVLERTREFGLLRALGLKKHQLMLLVLCETLLLSLLALLFGWVLGGGVHLWLSIHGLDLSSMMKSGTEIMGTFMDPIIYTELSWNRVWQITMVVFIATMSSGIYPAIKTARVTPVQALRT